MKTKQKSFILYDSDMFCLRYLTDKQAGILFKSIAALREDAPLPDISSDSALSIAFHQISAHMAMNEEKYAKICEQRAKAAEKRWRKDANASVCIQEDTKECYNDNDIVIDNENDNDIDNDNENDIVNDNDNDIVIGNENEIVSDIVVDNEMGALQAKKQKTKEENKKPLYDMSSVENFFLSAKKAQHQGSSL